MIGKNKLRKIINFIFIVVVVLMVSCVDNEKKTINIKGKVDILKIHGEDFLNQAIYYKEINIIDYKKSQFYEIENEKCIKYYSFFDTLKNKIGVDRYIIFKTSPMLKSDFSNKENIELEEYFFKDKNLLCLDLKDIPDYGIIEDIVFLNSDSIINGEESKRIKTIYQYINLKKKTNWIEQK